MRNPQPSAYRSCTSFSRRVCVAVGAILILGSSARAHDFWVDYDVDAWSPGREVSLFIIGGHRYPRSEALLADRLIDRFALRAPDGTWRDLKRRESDERWRADVAVDQPGWYVAELTVRRPRARSPNIVARALFRLGEAGDPPPDIGGGEGLEIVLSRLEGKTMLQTFLDGMLVSSGLVLYNSAGDVSRSGTSARNPLTWTLGGGKWLITAATGTQSATLVLNMDHHD